MLKRIYLTKLFPIFFLWIGLLLGFLPLYIHENDVKSILWEVCPITYIFMWLGLGVLLKRLYILVYIDNLTNLWNRRYLLISLEDEIKKLKKNNVLSLAIVDIDNFKSINDNYGHLFGDKVLMELAKILKNSIRQNDIIARWGGEEFIIILPETDAKGGKAVFERIRQIVEKYNFGCRITISGGIAFIKTCIEADKLIEMADKALYKAKRTKNMIALYKD